MPDIPDLTNHPGTEAVHFGEASGIPGLHTPPARRGDTGLASLKKAELAALAEQRGVDPSGTKAELIERLTAATSAGGETSDNHDADESASTSEEDA